MTLVADGPHMAAWVNGVQVSDWTDTRDRRTTIRATASALEPGTLIIQGHDPTTDLSFRNLKAAETPKRNAEIEIATVGGQASVENVVTLMRSLPDSRPVDILAFRLVTALSASTCRCEKFHDLRRYFSARIL